MMKTAPLLLAFVCGLSLVVRLSAFDGEPATLAEFRGLTLPQWIERLAKGRFGDTPAAWDDPPTEALEALPNYGAAAIPPLIKALQSESSIVRYNAAMALQRIKVDRKAAVPALTKLLQDEHVQVRAGAANTLGSIGVDSAEAIPELAKLLDDEATHSIGTLSMLPGGKWFYWSPADSARRALIAIGSKSVPVFLQRLKSQDVSTRGTGVAALSWFPANAAAIVPELTRALDDAEPSIRGTAADALGEFGKAAKSATSALTRRVVDRDEYYVAVSIDFQIEVTVGERSIAALRAVGPSSEDVSRLVEVLVAETNARRRDPKASKGRIDLRPQIIELMGDLKAEAPRTIPTLVAALEVEELRCDAALAILRLVGEHPYARTVLLNGLRLGVPEHCSWSVCHQAIRLIRERKWSDDAVLAVLAATLSNDSAELQVAASAALLCLEPDHAEARKVFQKSIEDYLKSYFPYCESDETWIEFMSAVRQSPRVAELAAPAIIGQIYPFYLEDEGDRRVVVETLLAIGPYCSDSVPEVVRELESATEADDRRVAAFVLGFVGRMNRQAASALLVALKDEDDLVRAFATESLGRIAIAEAIVLDELTAALNDESLAVREKAAEALKLLKTEPAPH